MHRGSVKIQIKDFTYSGQVGGADNLAKKAGVFIWGIDLGEGLHRIGTMDHARITVGEQVIDFCGCRKSLLVRVRSLLRDVRNQQRFTFSTSTAPSRHCTR